MVSVLIVGGTRGLGASLTKQYAAQSSNSVFATARAGSTATEGSNIQWLHGVDLTQSDVGDKLANLLKGKKPLDIVASALCSPSRIYFPLTSNT